MQSVRQEGYPEVQRVQAQDPGTAQDGGPSGFCTYCCVRPAETDDHVPPKCLFPRPRPSNLITVPSCGICNQGAGLDEEYFLATLMFTEAGSSPAGRELWQQKLRRMYAKNLGLRYRIAASLRQVNLVTPAGLFLGRGLTQRPDFARLEKVVIKVVRGLYYLEHSVSLSPQMVVEALFLRGDLEREVAQQYGSMYRHGQRAWPGIFSYRVADCPQGSMWELRFYDFATFWALTHDGAVLTAGTTS